MGRDELLYDDQPNCSINHLTHDENIGFMSDGSPHVHPHRLGRLSVHEPKPPNPLTPPLLLFVRSGTFTSRALTAPPQKHTTSPRLLCRLWRSPRTARSLSEPQPSCSPRSTQRYRSHAQPCPPPTGRTRLQSDPPPRFQALFHQVKLTLSSLSYRITPALVLYRVHSRASADVVAVFASSPIYAIGACRTQYMRASDLLASHSAQSPTTSNASPLRLSSSQADPRSKSITRTERRTTRRRTSGRR